MNPSAPTVTDALSELLSALGFETMARDVRTETDYERLRRYASVILKNTPNLETKRNLYSRFALIGLV